ncbi:DUF3631 domain-containing protein [Streptomyces halobius]|uniref:DUF3631 domain-containing protein n=1 Tax=Streptomyces halobius TaxID=2879846 RepID=A0ABY4M228_9ACTN|nr:DUF3631 domain-containing protein [Streptomyces halobius]UQA91537.1 DUF3631 domain-containing protein [Streptomyces halobius]
MQPATPEPYSAPSNAVWPTSAVPGQPGAHLRGEGAEEANDDHGDRSHGTEEQAPPVGSEEVPNREPAEGALVLADLRAQLKRYVVLPSEEALTAVTLWVAATHLQHAWQHAPRLAVVAPEKRCGKSRLLEVALETVHNRLITVNASAAAIFRSITEEDPPTLLVDEADTLFGTAKAAEKNEEVRGLLNAGHQRNRPTLRVSGPEHKVQEFPTFAMAALAGIDDLPDTIMDRSVVIRMRRRAAGEKVAHFRTSRDTPALHAIRDRLAAWLPPLHAQAMEMEPVMPVEDRAADTWEPLVIVADLAGGEWPALARTACRIMTDYEAGQDEEGGTRTRLLVGIRRAFAAENDPAVLGTKRLLEHLNADKEAPWAEYGPNGLTARALQLLLKPYGISSANRRFPDGTQAKGFARNQFLDAWARYCPAPKPPVGPAQPVAEPLLGVAA